MTSENAIAAGTGSKPGKAFAKNQDNQAVKPRRSDTGMNATATNNQISHREGA